MFTADHSFIKSLLRNWCGRRRSGTEINFVRIHYLVCFL